MKIFKKGFSLAEILIAVAIVSVIATMGFSVAKKNTERAFDLYVYTGYKGLTDAIAEANMNGYVMLSNQQNNLSETCDYIRKILSVPDEDYNYNPNPSSHIYTFKTPNNIEYKIAIPLNSVVYNIVMSVPAPKTKVNPDSRKTYCFKYTPSSEIFNVLVPVEQVTIGVQTFKSSADLQKRIDLLPFYIDDGYTGRTIYNANTKKSEYNKKEYLSFLEAACKLYSRADKSKTQELGFECTNASVEAIGALKVENPRKAF